jgi:retron-type reverse transcriptase
LKNTSSLMAIIQSRKALERAWEVIKENAQTSTSDEVRSEVQAFAEKATENINSLSGQLAKRSFKFGKAKGIPIPKKAPDGKKSGKFRPIVLAPLKSRIVQRVVLDALSTVDALKPFSENPYSFGGIVKSKDGLGAVPAAVEAVLKAIGEGATHVAFADIRSFFTKVPKQQVLKIISEAVDDSEFSAFVAEAVKVELENMVDLKEKAEAFPIHDIGVAQGNSLSPLLGNIVLHDFDRQMNEGDCRCVRYIDDFIILAPSAAAAQARMRLATRILAKLDMSLSAEKSSIEPLSVTDRFDFLGIEFNNGLLRPSKKAVNRLCDNVSARLEKSLRGMRSTKPGDLIPRQHSFVATLNRVDSIIRGWGKHYRFCNDRDVFKRIDNQLHERVGKYLARYRDIKQKRPAADAASLLGIDELAHHKRAELPWPVRSKPPTR